MFRASSVHLQEDTVVHKQHIELSLSMGFPGGLSIAAYRQANRNSYREWRYHMLLDTTMSSWR